MRLWTELGGDIMKWTARCCCVGTVLALGLLGEAARAAELPSSGSRTAISAPRQLSTTVNYTIEIAGVGSVAGTIGDEQVSCNSTCTKRVRGGTPVQLTATALVLYRFNQWRGCTVAVDGTTCRTVVPTNSLVGGVGVVFTDPTAAARQSLCEALPMMCNRCSTPGYRAAFPLECSDLAKLLSNLPR